MNQMFMVDIETTGTVLAKCDILQIGALELTKRLDGFWQPGRRLCMELHTDQTPENDWLRDNLGPLFERCHQAPLRTPAEVRAALKGFFAECSPAPLVYLTGLNASGFDVPWLVGKGFLQAPYKDASNQMVGDFHYRIYEITGAHLLACDVLAQDRKTVIDRAMAAYPEIELPEGIKAHDAMYDCLAQTRLLNGLIRLLGGNK